MNSEKKQRTKCFKTAEEAVNHRNAMLLQTAFKRGVDSDLASRKTQHPETGATLPYGVRYMSHVPATPYQASWNDASGALQMKYFISADEATIHRKAMVSQTTLHKRASIDPNIIGLKANDATTGRKLPNGIMYAPHCPTAPYQANWQGLDRRQHAKCFDTVEKALQHRTQMLHQVSSERNASGSPDFTNAKSFAIESLCLSKCIKSCRELGLDVRLWQAGTRSDFGHRPIDCTVDLWLPVQAKSTLVSSPPYRFFVRGEYAMDMACFPGHHAGGYVFSAQFMRENKKSLYSDKCMYIATGSAFDEPLLKWPDYTQRMLGRWNAEFAAHQTDVELGRDGNDRVSMLRSELELRMQCTENSQREIAVQMLIQAVIVGRKYEWPDEPNGVVDRLVDGRRVQDKVVRAVAGSASFHAPMTKQKDGKKVPYADGDVDLFVLATVHERLRLLLVWEIPADELKRLGLLSTGSASGRTSLVLPIASSEGANKELEKQIFGTKVYAGCRDVARFLRVYPLPEGYVVPVCMQGRDPRKCE